MKKGAAIFRIVFAWCLMCFLVPVTAQNILSEMNQDAHQVYDRMIILSGGGDSSLHSAIKPYLRSDLVVLANTFSAVANHPSEKYQIQSVYHQNNEFVIPAADGLSSFHTYLDSVFTFPDVAERYQRSKRSLWKTFYKTPEQFYEVDVKDFYLRVNPVLHIAAGTETQEGVATFYNQRGLSLRGGIGKNVFFQTSFYDSQVGFPNYINQYIDSLGVVPGGALYKNFDSKLFNVANGRDFLLANAYIGINFGKYIGMQLGHNQFFVGDGIRSLFVSDFSPPYFSLKFNTRIWKLHYQNIFAEISADNFMVVNGISEPVPKKYMAAHFLSYKPNKTLTLGLFESVVFDRDNNQFELQYLNPIILYRTVEGWIGSPDNVLLGFSFRQDIKRTLSVYGQFMLDDISFRQIFDGHLDWWGNKFGYQIGGKYINAFGIHMLDLQVEWNRVRPYTYSHYDYQANYSNYKQTLAHPLGGNFNEWIISGRYQATKRMLLKSNIHLITTGEDLDSISYGSNVIFPNTHRQGDYGNHVAQGVHTTILYWSSALVYELTPGLFFDGRFVFRNKTSDIKERNLKTTLFQVGIRVNLAYREDVF
jgi:hypothetical protein